MAQSTSGYVDVNGGKLYYEAAGEGHPLVLIHAGIADHRMWDDQWEAFTSRYRTIRYDTRGFGKTTSESVTFSNRDDLRALLDHLGVDKAYLVGVSRGGQIAIDFTLESPERVAALITVGSGPGGFSDVELPPEQEARFDEMERLEEAGDTETVIRLGIEAWLAGFHRTVDQMPAHLVQRMVEMGRTNYSHTEQLTPIPLDPPAVARLNEINVPTLIIWGDIDEAYALAASPYLADNIAGARRAIISGTAHMPNMEKPEEFSLIVMDFLKSL